MQNGYSRWKLALIVVVTGLAAVYALPNIYPEVPAVQVSHEKDVLSAADRARITSILTQANLIDIDNTVIEVRTGSSLLIHMSDAQAQLRAVELLQQELSDRYVVAFNLASKLPGWLKTIGAQPMKLGLDLRGGVYFLLTVDNAAVVRKALNRYHDELKVYFRAAQIRYRESRVENAELVLVFANAQQHDRAIQFVKKRLPGVFDLPPPDASTDALRLRLSAQSIKETFDFAVQQNIVTLRKRVNELGVAEPVVTRHGRERIVVQLPGVQDTAQAKEILGATATLEFRLVDETADAERVHRSGRVPYRADLYFTRAAEPVVLKRDVMLTGEHIIDAASGIDGNTGSPAVFITLDSKGAQIFSRITARNIKNLMGVVFIENKVETTRGADGTLEKQRRVVKEVISVARIQEKLSKRFQITGLDSATEARRLALLLRAGALAAPLEIIEERTVGPSLGQANIEQGQRSILLAFLLVVVFIGIYYRLFGLIANFALIANIFLIVAVMSLIPGATLTLPGIIGIVLTVGMAVDANVLIFERIREELDNGNAAHASIASGYRQAFSTIADANITTLIAALVLFAFGTGPIKGFAVTLSIGIISSMFTAIMGTRALVGLIYGRHKTPVLAI